MAYKKCDEYGAMGKSAGEGKKELGHLHPGGSFWGTGSQ